VRRLIITADDYGYVPRYDEGILVAARAGAIDAVSAFSLRPGLRPEPLLETGVEIGLHLDLAEPGDAARATEFDRERAGAEIRRQSERFIRRFGRSPAYLDGHHHCHARDGLGAVVADIAVARQLPVRSISARQRRLLRCRGVATCDLLVGRLNEDEPALPGELADPDALADLDAGAVIEWMVHPGYRDPDAESDYDAGREQDLELLLSWEPAAGLVRTTHATLRDAAAPAEVGGD
jgi:predicted glycoside hydrolase/deacetylase ChbG (UPF0249 family)